MSRRYRVALRLFPCVLVLLFLAPACSGPSRDRVSLSGLTMGTTWSVDVAGARADRRKLNEDIAAVLDDVNRKMSTYLPDSELSRLNRAPGGTWFPLSDELYRVIREALRVGAETGGAFDITIGPAVNLWGFGPDKHTAIPAAADIEAALAETGPGKIELRSSPPALRKHDARVYLDLSGIAKGYAVDRIASLLERAGFRDFLVDIGGEVRARGKSARGDVWRIGIEKPITGARAVERIIDLDNIAMATSGDYRNYFVNNGVRYSHTIDPRNGRPVSHNLVSVTVLHPAAMTADALATGLLVLGPERGLDLARQLGLAVFFISRSDHGFTERYTEPFTWFLPEK